jgi:hypothetical protein
VGALVTYLLRSLSIHNIHCIAYASPSCVDESTADHMREYVTSVILHDDVIARITPTSIRILLNEIKPFRAEVFRHLQQDWQDTLSRAASLWSPRTRDTPAADQRSPGDSRADASPSPSPMKDPPAVSPCDGSDDEVLVSEEDLIQLWLPGRILHVYSQRGIYKISSVSRTFPHLRRIPVQGNIFRDHSSVAIFDGLLEVWDIIWQHYCAVSI